MHTIPKNPIDTATSKAFKPILSIINPNSGNKIAEIKNGIEIMPAASVIERDCFLQ